MTTAASDSDYAFQHVKEQTIAVECSQCGHYYPFKLAAHGLADIEITLAPHECAKGEE